MQGKGRGVGLSPIWSIIACDEGANLPTRPNPNQRKTVCLSRSSKSRKAKSHKIVNFVRSRERERERERESHAGEKKFEAEEPD
jgi:hypothetical protein